MEIKTQHKYSEILRQIKGMKGTRPIDVIRNFTLEPIFSDYLLWYDHRLSVCYLDPYTCLETDNASEEVVVILDLPAMNPSLIDFFYTFNKEQIAGEEDKIKRYLDLIFDHLQAHYQQILFFTFSPDFYDMTPIGQNNYNDFVSRMNIYLNDLAKGISHLMLIDISVIIARMGADHFFDVKGKYFINSLCSTQACEVLASEIVQAFKRMNTPPKKCLILDCDQVLWGGIVSEDGMDHIKLSRQLEGKAYRDLQREVLKLYEQGILIGLCSKNNEQDVWEVLDHHPDMLIKKKHIAVHRINWNSKAENIQEMAAELNISLDSMVFVDDNPYETNLVKEMLPQVETITLDPKNPHTYSQIIKQTFWFRRSYITQEDKDRSIQYKAQTQRNQQREALINIDDYHQSLKTQTSIVDADPFSIPRIAALSQRVNQFNLSAIRYTEENIVNFCKSDSHDVLCMKANDIFGDMGIIGACVLCYQQNQMTIQAFMLSCRALGRGFENQMIDEIKTRARGRECKTIQGVYLPTEKNKSYNDFYQKHGVVTANET